MVVLWWLCEGLRAVCGVLAVPIILMTARGTFSYPHRQTLRNGVKSIAFLGALSSGSYQWSHFIQNLPSAPVSTRLLFSLTLTTCLMIVSLLILIRMQRKPVELIEKIRDHMGVVLAITELDEVSPLEAEAIADHCRKIVAERILESDRG